MSRVTITLTCHECGHEQESTDRGPTLAVMELERQGWGVPRLTRRHLVHRNDIRNWAYCPECCLD